MTHNAENDASCHPACVLGNSDHPGYIGYRCMDEDGNTLPFPGEPYPYAHDYPRVTPPGSTAAESDLRDLLTDYTNWLAQRPGWWAEPKATLEAFLGARRLASEEDDRG